MARITIALETEDLERIEQACRALADRYRRDAEANKGGSVREVFLRSEEEFLRLADRMKAAREAPPSNVRALNTSAKLLKDSFS